MIDVMGFYFLFWNSYLVLMPGWGFNGCGQNEKFRYRWYYNVLMCIIKLSLDQRAKNKFPSYTQCWWGKFFLHSFNYIVVDHTIPSYLRSYVMPTHAHRIHNLFFFNVLNYCTLPCGWFNVFCIAIWIPRAQWVGVKAKQFARPQAVYPYYAS